MPQPDIACSIAEMGGWRITTSPDGPCDGTTPPTGGFGPVHADASGLLLQRAGPAGRPIYRISIRGEGCATVDWQRREIRVRSGPAGAQAPDPSTFVDDHIAPRILSRLWPLVLHAGIVARGDGCILLAGPTGHGKSTLTAFLHRSGWTMQGDDAAIIEIAGATVLARPTYRRLSLFPDSAEHALREPAGPLADPDTKLRVSLAGMAPQTQALPVLAILVLAAPQTGSAIGERPLCGAEACMSLLSNSFSFDPTDAAESMRRLAGARQVALSVPVIEIAYPRDYAALPALRAMLAATLATLDAKGSPP